MTGAGTEWHASHATIRQKPTFSAIYAKANGFLIRNA
jgi:hypothetical protein